MQPPTTPVIWRGVPGGRFGTVAQRTSPRPAALGQPPFVNGYVGAANSKPDPSFAERP